MPKTTSTQHPSQKAPHPFPPGEVVDPAWILKAGAVVVAVALLCSYLVLCVLFAKSQWQFVLHPSREVTATPASQGLAFAPIRFGVDTTGQPQLDGWWIAADLPGGPTALLLHSGDGSMSDALPQARLLHDANLNVLLFDYRGFGHSGGLHPTETLMQADAESALTYLVSTRDLPPRKILVFGEGSAAAIAVGLCADHKDVAALILSMPDGDFEDRVRADVRAKLVPVRMLFDEPFALAVPLRTLATPKLILTRADDKHPVNPRQVADPKMTVEYTNKTALPVSLRRFLDDYLPR